MALHCPNCNYDTDDAFADACPICRKPLLTDDEVRRDWGGYAGNPGPWYGRLRTVQKLYFAGFVIFTIVAIVYWVNFWLKNKP